jgi:hypothetical protein
VSQGKSAKLWKTMETLGSAVAMGWSCQKTSPADGVERPVSMRRRVDLPEPEGPSRARISPSQTERFVGAMTWMRFSLGWA